MTIQIHPRPPDPDNPESIFVRYNGWTRPHHYFQLIGWSLYITFGLLNFILLIPNFKNIYVSVPLLVFNAILYLSHFVCHLIAASINPIDQNVLKKYNNNLKPHKFDRSKHKHVIENQFCYICESQVGTKSKHCSLCNKCVSDFDHHCKWLNNCVGGRNYRWFAWSMFTALVHSTAILAATIAHIVSCHLYQNYSEQVPQLVLLHYKFNLEGWIRVAWLTVLYITLIISVISTLLLIHLCLFHIFLAIIGESTYEFVMRQRALITEHQSRNGPEKKNQPIAFSLNFKNNFTSFFKAKNKIDSHDSNSRKFNGIVKNDTNNIEKINHTYNMQHDLKV